jgi:tetratricopeptide (TPR) repeat protein
MQLLTLLLALVLFFLIGSDCTAQPKSDRTPQQMFLQQDWDSLERFGNEWVRMNPNDARAWYNVGEAAQHKGRYKDAIAAFKKATVLDPTDPFYWNNLAANYTFIENMQAALETMNEGERVCIAAGTMKANHWFMYGNAFANLIQVDHAKQDYEKAVAADPRFGAAWTNLGLLHELTGDMNGARIDYNKGASLGDEAGQYNARTLQSRIEAARARRVAASHPSSSGNSTGRLLNYMWAENQKALNAGTAVPYGGH